MPQIFANAVSKVWMPSAHPMSCLISHMFSICITESQPWLICRNMTLGHFIICSHGRKDSIMFSLLYLQKKEVDYQIFEMFTSWNKMALQVSQKFSLPRQLFLPNHVFSSVQFSRSVVSDSLRPHGLHHARPPCLSPTPRVYPNSCPLSQ